ncbi:MAG: ABC transporter ATP-binding protein [Gemmataceae bacterium]
MTLPAIRVDQVAKLYQLGAAPTGDLNLTEVLRRTAANTYRKVRSLVFPGEIDETNGYWALRDVSFEVMPGEVVGIVGRNGAGKSTLLKLLSRITEPTRGRIEIRGRMGSLLEVGTGFHPELTGRENIFMNGSILGMSRREIRAKFDQIVEFAEIGKFLDTPVKRYSSGMYVRLAFAVAAHLEPEILVIDEVLAVGDAAFQKKCIDRMTELARSGRTILFVSHNMQLIPRLCQRAVMLEKGKVVRVGDAGSVTQDYMDRLLADTKAGNLRDKARTGDGRAKFVQVNLVDDKGTPLTQFTSGNDLVVRVVLEVREAVPDASLHVGVQTVYGARVVTAWSEEINTALSLKPGVQSFECRFEKLRLRPGHTIMLNLQAAADNMAMLDSVENAVVYDVTAAPQDHHLSTNPDMGVVICDYTWREVETVRTVAAEPIPDAAAAPGSRNEMTATAP